MVMGLDIGTSAVKFVDLKDTGRGYQVENMGLTSLPPETIVDGSLMDATTVVEAIGELIAHYKIKKREVAVAVSGHSLAELRDGSLAGGERDLVHERGLLRERRGLQHRCGYHLEDPEPLTFWLNGSFITCA